MPFAPPLPVPITDAPPIRSPKAPTARNSPHLTPVQLRIARRRHFRDECARNRLAQTLPGPSPTHPAQGNEQQPERQNQQASGNPERTMLQRWRKRRRTQLLQQPQQNQHPRPPLPARALPVTLDRLGKN